MEVDVERQRIGLSLRLNDEPGQPAPKKRGGGRQGGPKSKGGNNKGGKKPRGNQNHGGGSLADALRNAGFGR